MGRASRWARTVSASEPPWPAPTAASCEPFQVECSPVCDALDLAFRLGSSCLGFAPVACNALRPLWTAVIQHLALRHSPIGWSCTGLALQPTPSWCMQAVAATAKASSRSLARVTHPTYLDRAEAKSCIPTSGNG